MNIKIWCKTLLTMYRYLQPLTDSIDRIIGKQTMLSNHNNTLHHANYIIELTDKKIDLINLKIIIDEILLKISKQNTKMIILKYCDGLSSAEICDLLEIDNVRTYFRKLQMSHVSFEKVLSKYLREREDCFEKLLRQTWIQSVYKHYSDKINMGRMVAVSSIKKIFFKELKANF